MCVCVCFQKERVNISLSINDKIDDNLRQIKRKLILYRSDLERLKNEVLNTVSDKRIRAELTLVSIVMYVSYSHLQCSFLILDHIR
jgi:hypothetical protein